MTERLLKSERSEVREELSLKVYKAIHEVNALQSSFCR
jgi:hypothetical protein